MSEPGIAESSAERTAAWPLTLLPCRAAKALELAAFGVILALFVTTQVRCFTPAHIEDDIDAYIWLAKRMANLQPLSVEPEPFRFHAHPYVQTPDGKVTVKYAPGGPAAMAVAYRLVGDKGVFLVSPIAGGLAIRVARHSFRHSGQPLIIDILLCAIRVNP